MSLNLSSTTWWKAALVRALRTAIAIAIPYAGANTLFSGLPWLTVADAAGLGFVLSLLTSLAGIAEASGTPVPVWYAIVEKVAKTVAQALLAGVGNALLFSDVHWSLILQAALIAGLGTLLSSLLAVLPAVAAAVNAPSGHAVTVIEAANPQALAHEVAKHLAGTPPAASN